MARYVLIEGLGRSGAGKLLPAGAVRLPLPAWEGFALPSYAPEALADLMDSLLPDGPNVVVGVSLGGSIALAMRSPSIVGVVALDPPLSPQKVPELVAKVHDRILPARPDLAQFFNESFATFPIRNTAPIAVAIGPYANDDEGRLPATAATRRTPQHDVVRYDPDCVKWALDHVTMRMTTT